MTSDITDQMDKHDKDKTIVTMEDLIDTNTFDQLLDMDDEEDHEFSYSLVVNYFEQAEETFKDMDAALYVYNIYNIYIYIFNMEF